MMSKRKTNLGGGYNNLGSKSYKQRIIVSNNSKVKAGSILVINPKNVKGGINTYTTRKHRIHAKIDGKVIIKDGKIEIV